MRMIAAAVLTAALATTASAAARQRSEARSTPVSHVGSASRSYSPGAYRASLRVAAPRAALGASAAASRFSAAAAPARVTRAARAPARYSRLPRSLGGRMRREDNGDPGSSGDGTTTAPQTLPAGAFGTVPGALIRTEGLGYQQAQPDAPSRYHVVEAGDHIALDESKPFYLLSTRGTHVGPRDTPPGANPNGDASGRTAITANSVPLE